MEKYLWTPKHLLEHTVEMSQVPEVPDNNDIIIWVLLSWGGLEMNSY